MNVTVKNANSVALLSAYATIKSISETKKYSNYTQLLAEFIRYIVSKEELKEFDEYTMVELLKKHFGFTLIGAVVRTALKGMKEIKIDNKRYTVNKNRIINLEFEEALENAITKSRETTKTIYDYICKKLNCSEIDEELLTKQIINFLTDEQHHGEQYIDLISEFVFKNEDETIQDQLNQIREGSILYLGLSSNVSEIGSITKQITLYLNTEILFSLAGYNGDIYKRLTEDFLELVRRSNSGKRVVKLSYFSDVKVEIDNFFFAAESIIDEKRSLYNKPAMKKILENCTTGSDVQVKQSDFYYYINEILEIEEDDYNYYSEELNCYSLESADIIRGDYSKEKVDLGYKYISNINKLRKEKNKVSILDSGYLLITNSDLILSISSECARGIKDIGDNNISIAEFAVSLEKITNLLWCKLGYCFSTDSYPVNVDSVLRARLILSSNIVHNALEIYKATNEQYKNGIISEGQLAARIIALKSKEKYPEQLQKDNIDKTLDFTSSWLLSIEETLQSNTQSIDDLRNVVKLNNEEISKKDRVIADQNQIITKQMNELLDLKANEKKSKFHTRLALVLATVLLTGLIAALVYTFAPVETKNFIIAFSTVVGALAAFLQVAIALYSKNIE